MSRAAESRAHTNARTQQRRRSCIRDRFGSINPAGRNEAKEHAEVGKQRIPVLLCQQLALHLPGFQPQPLNMKPTHLKVCSQRSEAKKNHNNIVTHTDTNLRNLSQAT
ncbi:uncharacterized protein LOC119768915 [Culex quinquefasciatus]|uniref:uncharacterized protein LOC119768915 n=1 Tax=Culex quinquefasciatus TaxID=7176 RepID=UPI0018E2F67D|nr:uncharacterized protein LOC119768915 [Culex quinquefasciatus]